MCALRHAPKHLVCLSSALTHPFICLLHAGKRLKWTSDLNRYAAWAEGRTGLPLVDANMRELQQTGARTRAWLRGCLLLLRGSAWWGRCLRLHALKQWTRLL